MLLLTALCAGCQSYHPAPPDLNAHLTTFLDRRPSTVLVSEAGATESEGTAADRELTLEQAEQVALVFNADLRLARSRAGITQATFDHAGLWDDPVLSIGVERMISSGSDPWSAMGSIGFTLPISGRLEIEKQRAGAAHHAALESIVEAEWRIRADVRRAWIEWSEVSLRADMTADFLDRLEHILRLVDRMVEVGELARIEAGLFHIERAQRANDARALSAAAEDRLIKLRRLLGLPPDVPIIAKRSVRFAPPTRDRSGEGEAALVRMQHPMIRTRLAEHEVTERSLHLAVRQQYPDLVIGPGYNYEDGANHILLGLSLPLPIFNRNQQRIAEARAARGYALAAVEAAYEALLSELAAANIQLGAAEEQLMHMTDVILPLVERQYEDARRIAELGKVDALLLLDTLRRQHEARLELIRLEAARSIAAVRVIELLGPPTEEATGEMRAVLPGGAKEVVR